MLPKNYILHAALHEDIAEGFVWLKGDVQARAIIEITNIANNARVVCEALQFEPNFLNRYNKAPRVTISEGNIESSIVINHWYRARLGWPGEPLRTRAECSLSIRPLGGPFAKVRACLDHPQVMVRVSTWLGILGFFLGLIGTVLGLAGTAFSVFPELPARAHELLSRRPSMAASNPGPQPRIASLAVDDVLAWRNTYGGLLGKSRDVAIERFGPPEKEEGLNLEWNESPRTGMRWLKLAYAPLGRKPVLVVVKAGVRPEETLDVMDVLKKATQFTFEAGIYSDSTESYFEATTKDGRNRLQFDVTERGPQLAYVMFLYTEYPAH